MKSLYACLSALVAVFLLAACIPAAELPPTNLPLNAEEPSATLQAVPVATLTPTQSITPIPPPTRRVATQPTSTTTQTPLASFTIPPTSKNSKTPSPTITGTYTRFVVPPGFGGPTWSLTPNPFKCTVVITSPEWGKEFKPRTNFMAYWKLQNTGSNMWHKDDIAIEYVSGTKMHNPVRDHNILDVTIYKTDYYNLEMQMRPPKEPGLYTTTFGFRKTNKQDFFCTFSITIRVISK